MFKKVDGAQQKSDFLDKAKNARQERAESKQKFDAAVAIQKHIRRYLVKCRLKRKLWQSLADILEIPSDAEAEYKPTFKPAIAVFKQLKNYLTLFSFNGEIQKLEYVCKYLVASMAAENTKHCYCSLVLIKEYTLPWIQQVKDILTFCAQSFHILKPETSNDMRAISTFLATLITFTSTNKWKFLSSKNGEALRPGMQQLCNNIMGHLNAKGLYPCLQALLNSGLARSKPAFRPASFTAIMTLALRPLVAANLSDNLLTLFLLHILSVPAVVHHMNIMSQECLIQMMTHRIFSRSIELLCHEQSTKIVFNALEGNYSLCLLANLIQLGNAEMEGLVESTNSFMFVVTRLLECCKIYVQSKKSSLSHWHPVLGWFQQKTDQGLYEALPLVERQLQMLWNVKMMHILFEQLFAYNDLQAVVEVKAQTATSKNIFKKALEKAASHKTSCKVRLDSPVLISTCLACGMYLTAIQTLTQLKLSILSGLTCQDVLLPRLWKLITDLGPQCGLKAFMDILSSQPNSTSHVLFNLLHLGCDTATHIITILDDIELYEQNKPFNQSQLVAISCFLNHFIFRSVWSSSMDSKVACNNPVFKSVHRFLMLLYQRDGRRSFSPPDHWLIKEIRLSTFMSELERSRKSAALFLLQKVPHVIPHKERVVLFRKNVSKEKDVLGITESACASPHSTLISIHRPRLIEDGYRQLSLLPSNALKGIIRVKFINEQGLDEAGIDQDGVFKEFLEETIMRVFDPSLNLFKVTSEQKLYPSSTSSIQENHLALFEFVGRMLGKAVYEGIVVDVPFAPFFLSQIMGHQHSATYSSMDELPSLDAELYKSLTYIKHYDGDISDLELTFSYDEDYLGKVITHELVPGGRVLPVTNENKINYVHLMAHFKMHSQIKEQTNAFIHGFRAIINPDWLAMFSTNELQKLISGDNLDVDLDDLRKHTQYYGGFHNSHKVVSWLWDILDRDFTPKERSLFLKFVTSCSKPPLLGFAHLEPPFSIRCVEVSDDQDTGDTVGSVLKGFFNIKKRDPVSRLPTSSTCFNLLKLPNYQKKATLREKLRYAITSNTGFELS